MERDARAYLWDVHEATTAIQTFTQGKTFDDYARELMLRSAIERQFEIIGEALSQLSKIDPALPGACLTSPRSWRFATSSFRATRCRQCAGMAHDPRVLA